VYGPVYLLKIDISDGFYRIDLNPDNIPHLGMAFPTCDGTEPLVAFPLVLPMGWKNSPPAFTTTTETIADLANEALQGQLTPTHPLDNKSGIKDFSIIASETPSGEPWPAPDPSITHSPQLTAEVNVYVNDFIVIDQGNQQCLKAIISMFMNSIYQV
jgi:hypothetical protein